MNSPAKLLLLLLGLMIPVLAISALKPVADKCSLPVEKQPLEQVLPCYLLKPDDAYSYQLEETEETSNKPLTIYTFRLTSQQWQPGGMVNPDQAIWQHRVEVYIPEAIKSPTALLYVNGGTLYPNPRPPEPNRAEIDFMRIASDTQSIVINLQDVPNQHLSFPDAPKALKEDDLIAFAWGKFIEDPEQNRHWLPRLPMVKSVIRTMDMVQEFTKNKNEVSGFVVSGGSKRGWTAWLAAAMDSRVEAVVPMVIDVLNVRPSMKHHEDAYGFLAPAVGSYKKFMGLLKTKEMADLLGIVDPYSYLKYLTIPKYIITASADDFFLPDSSQFYFDKLPSQKWIRVLPNERHYIVRNNAGLVTDTLLSFYSAYLQGRKPPEPIWKVEGNTLTVTVTEKPAVARLWHANNPESRDFRLKTDKLKKYLFSEEDISFSCHTQCQYTLKMPSPKSGWDAYFVQLNYANNVAPDLVVTTPVFIYPDDYPDREK